MPTLSNIARRIYLGSRRCKPEQIGPLDIEKILLKFHFQLQRCAYCNRQLSPSNWHIDHYFPLSRGGKHQNDNLCFACIPCNLLKHHHYPFRPLNHYPTLGREGDAYDIVYEDEAITDW